MAARKTRWNSDSIREKIKAGLLTKYLEDHASGSREMTQTQVTAALGLLDRCVPKLTAIEHSGDVTQRIVSADTPTADEWQAMYGEAVPPPSGSVHD